MSSSLVGTLVKTGEEMLVDFVSQSKQVCFLQSVNAGDTRQKRLYLRYKAGEEFVLLIYIGSRLTFVPKSGRALGEIVQSL